jgi:hypothetical protein
MIEMTRKIRIQIPPTAPNAIADVVDAETGEKLPCVSFSIHCDVEHGPTLRLELADFQASVVGTWECRLVKEEPR